MAEKIKKTNAMRILDGLKIQYETRDYYDDGEHELSRGAAVQQKNLVLMFLPVLKQ